MTEKTTSRSTKYLFDAFHAKCGDALAKLVLLNLANRANDDGECWPSLERIAMECETSTRTVIRKIEKLERLGHVRRVRRAKEGMKTSNLYVLPSAYQGFSVVTESHIDVSERHVVVSESHSGSDTVSPTVVTESHIKHAVETPNETPSRCDVDTEFDSWWARYPKKTGKGKAKIRFKKLSKSDREALLADDLVRRYGHRDRQYIKGGDTYISERRWEDEFDEVTEAPKYEGVVKW